MLAVELSSFQLHYTSSMSAQAAAVLNVAEDHLDWYASMAAYAADKGRIYENAQRACVYNVADPVTEELVREADVLEGARAIGFTLGMPSVGMLGVVEDILADRAFVEERETSAAELCTLADLTTEGTAGPAPHTVQNALAAAALARAHGVGQAAVRDGLRGFRPDAPPDRAGRRARRRRLGRRLQGHQPARRPGLAAGLRPGRVDRRRARQGRVVRRPGPDRRRPAARRRADGPRPRRSSPRHLRDTRRMCRSSSLIRVRLL